MDKNVVFISYRRVNGMVYTDNFVKFFRQFGISYFRDVDGLRKHTGEFKNKIRDNIINSENFLLFLTPNCFDGIKDPNTSMFLYEICVAFEHTKNIIPVVCGDFTFSENFPEIFKDIQCYGLDCYDCLKKLKHYEYINYEECMAKTRYSDNEFLFFVDILAKMQQTDIITQTIKKITSVTALKSRKIIESKYSFLERLSSDVTEVSMCAMACQGILITNRDCLEKIAENGCKIRFIMNDPKSPAAKEAAKMLIKGGSQKQIDNIIPESYNGLKEWKGKYPDNIDYRLTDLYLNCAIFIVKHKNPQNDTIKVDYYSFNCLDSERRCVYISANDSENFKFYEEQFEWIWNNPKKGV